MLRQLVQHLHLYTQWPRLDMMEIGSFEGQSALVWSHAIAEYFPEGGSVLCVDPWKPYHSEHQLGQGTIYGEMDAMLRSGDAYTAFLENIKEAHEKCPIRHLRGTLEEMLPGLPNELFGLVYVDGDHRYSAVIKDLQLAEALVRPAGIMCGDDLERQFDRDHPQPEMALADTDDFVANFHPGVTKAVYEMFGTVWCRAAVWAVRRGSDKHIFFTYEE